MKKVNELSTQYLSESEQAASYIFPVNLSEEELQAANLEIKVFRMQRLQAMTDQQRLHAELLRLKFQMEDYFKLDSYVDKLNDKKKGQG